MSPQQRSSYGQMPGAYPAAEDKEAEAYLEMMNELAGK